MLCLVDDDGNVFSLELDLTSHTGGGQAAHLLNCGIMQRLKTPMGENLRIWFTTYCNLTGLRGTFIDYRCIVEQYDAFIEGFNMAAPLFSIVDAGSSKEATDMKLKGLCPAPLESLSLHH